MFRATADAASGREREVGMLVVLLRDRERRAAVDDRLHRRADRPRVRDVVAEVRAVVDARRDEVEAVAEVAEEGDADGVGRGAVDGVGERAVAERPLPDAERPHQRLLVADRALVRVGRDDGRVADRVERLLEREQPARLDAVVVRDEDPRPRRPVAERLGDRPQRPRPAMPRIAAPGDRLAALLVEVAPLGPGPLPGHVRRVAAGPSAPVLVAVSRPVAVLRLGHGTSLSTPGAGSRGIRIGRPSRFSTRFAARSATGAVSRVIAR